MAFLTRNRFPIRHALSACTLPLLLSGCFNKPADISGNLERATQHIAEGHTALAKIELEQAVRLKPGDPVANLRLARIEDADGELSKAVPHYLRAATLEARQIEAQLRVIEILIDSGRFADALGRINTTLGSFPNNVSALALRADLEERENQDTAARNDAAEVLQRDPSNARALATMALLELKAKNGQQALAFIQKGLAATPQDLRLLQVQAAALLTLDQPDKAVAALDKIVTIAPRNIEARMALADIETRNGKFDDAFRGLKNAVAADPSNQDLKLSLVKFLARQKKDADLVTYLKDQIVQDPKSSIYDLLLAEFERSQGKLDDSQAILTAAVARLGKGPDGSVVRVALAKITLAQGHTAEAMAQLNDVLETDPDDKDALLTRAVLEKNNGQAAAAIADASKVTRTDPVNVQAYEVLATTYMQFGQPKLAIESMRRAVAIVPGDDRAQMRLATFLQTAGDLTAAREVVARITQAHAESGDIWTTAAQLAIERRDWTAATNAVSHLRAIPGMSEASIVLNARIAVGQKNFAAASATFRSLIDKTPDVDPAVIASFASASVAQNEGDAAIAYLRGRIPALGEAGKLAAWGSIMTMQADAGHFDAAGAAYAEARALAPTDMALLQTYVRILLSQRAYDSATAAVTASKAGISPLSYDMLMGNIAEARGDLAAAEASYKKAYEANPLSVPALNNYASLAADRDATDLALLGRLRGKFAGLEQVVDTSLIDTIAWLDYRLNQLDEAKSLLTRINARESDSAQLRFHAAAVMLASGDKEGGKAVLDTVKDKTFPGMDEARNLAAM